MEERIREYYNIGPIILVLMLVSIIAFGITVLVGVSFPINLAILILGFLVSFFFGMFCANSVLLNIQHELLEMQEKHTTEINKIMRENEERS